MSIMDTNTKYRVTQLWYPEFGKGGSSERETLAETNIDEIDRRDRPAEIAEDRGSVSIISQDGPSPWSLYKPLYDVYTTENNWLAVCEVTAEPTAVGFCSQKASSNLVVVLDTRHHSLDRYHSMPLEEITQLHHQNIVTALQVYQQHEVLTHVVLEYPGISLSTITGLPALDDVHMAAITSQVSVGLPGSSHTDLRRCWTELNFSRHMTLAAYHCLAQGCSFTPMAS